MPTLSALGLFLAACSSTVEWDSVTATADDFKKCLASPSSTWQKPASAAAFAATPVLLAEVGQLYPETNAFELLLAQGPAAATAKFALLGAGDRIDPASVNAALRSLAVAADAAADVVRHPVHGRLVHMVEEIRSGKPATPVAIDLDDASDYARLVQRADSADGWAALAQSEMLFAVNALQSPTAEARSSQRIGQGLRTALYVKAYLNAYFRGGRVVGLTLNADAVNQLSAILRQDLVTELKTELQALLDKATAQDMFKLGDVAFVSRGGASRQFPGFSATYAPGLGRPQFSEIPAGDVGADIVRVTLEGFFDSFFGLPAVSNATGVGLTARVDGADIAIGLPEFSKLDPAPFDKEAFGKIDERANSVEGFVRPPLQTALIGVSVFGTNNELLANLIATTVAVSARKATEYTAWCYEYARAKLPPSGLGPLSSDRDRRGIVDEIGVDLVLGTTRNAVKVVIDR